MLQIRKSTFCQKVTVYIMAVQVVEFKNGGYKIRKVFAQESTSLMEIIEFWELD